MNCDKIWDKIFFIILCVTQETLKNSEYTHVRNIYISDTYLVYVCFDSSNVLYLRHGDLYLKSHREYKSPKASLKQCTYQEI